MARKKSTKDTFAAYITQLAEDYAPKNIELQLAFRIGAQAAMKWVMSTSTTSLPTNKASTDHAPKHADDDEFVPDGWENV